MDFKNMTPEERTKLQQENPEEYEKLAAAEQNKPRTAVRYINGQAIHTDPTAQSRWVNGRLVQ